MTLGNRLHQHVNILNFVFNTKNFMWLQKLEKKLEKKTGKCTKQNTQKKTDKKKTNRKQRKQRTRRNHRKEKRRQEDKCEKLASPLSVLSKCCPAPAAKCNDPTGTSRIRFHYNTSEQPKWVTALNPGVPYRSACDAKGEVLALDGGRHQEPGNCR
ncbi:hypothetical protein K458DRAFT_148681 [Lentithecium fluviatile CBS 122367]|uniref:Uncharacterized protein n=1 Tax=Lentithecium fluviatile CBS 122367 TaxID=1168545 RepID=A0A6G1JD53_9PLEO|nr:hypothetical protein K458DRAFT_148681 [Lentithecium fluviatile CBS 122367]